MTPGPARHAAGRIVRTALAVLLVAGLAVAVYVGLHWQGSDDMRERAPDSLESAGREVGVKFPPAARLVGVHRERGLDDLVAVKVEMAASEWPAFLAGTPVDPKSFRAGERGLLGPDEGFWDPHKARNLRTAEVSLPDARALNIGFDDSRPGIVVVYVVNHGT